MTVSFSPFDQAGVTTVNAVAGNRLTVAVS
jgi:hypothetical protein